MNQMDSLDSVLSGWAREAFCAAFPDLDPALLSLDVLPTGDESFGDYQCNAAMSAAKILRRKPREVAELVARAVPLPGAVDRIEIAGAGFINFFIRTDWLASHLERIQQDPRLGVPRPGSGRTVVLDYSSPNVAKPMHIGHIRSTVIGNALDRLHRFVGYRVIADNHLGDWGTQFGLLILGYRSFIDLEAYEREPIEELERIYRESYTRGESDPAWRAQAKAEVVKLQAGDPANLALWQSFVDHSRREFDRIYRRLDVRFDLVRGESFYNPKLPSLVENLERRNLARESDGALCIFSDGTLPPREDPLLKQEDGEWRPNPCLVRKTDGAFNYATTDIATILSRVEEFAPDRIVYVTDERQQLHFRQVFEVARRLGVTTPLIHVWFGLMRLPEGTFSTRQGNVIKLERLLDEAEERALEIVKQASPGMPAEQQKEVARAVGIGAVKYADLSQNPQSMVTFTWEKALSLEGNSAPYLQYACARIASVRDRYAERFPGTNPDTFPVVLSEPVERRLALRLLRFPSVVVRATATFRPNLLADYLYELAQVYSTFYQTTPFLKAEEGVRESRVRLCALVAATLGRGLEILGIETPARI